MPPVRSLACLAAALLTLTALAGCIAVPGAEHEAPEDVEAQETTVTPPENPPNATMTGEETVADSEGLNQGVPPLFHATRVHTIAGEITLATLPVDLSTVNGGIVVTQGEPGRWSLTATLRGYGATPQQAQEARDTLTFTWSHETPEGHHLVAIIEQEPMAGQVLPGVTLGYAHAESLLELVLPPDLVASLSASTTNGHVVGENVLADVASFSTTNGHVALSNVTANLVKASSTNGGLELKDVSASEVVAETTNGNVDAALTGTTSVHLASTNGNILARVMPGASGVLSAESTNGNLDVAVPEGAAYGYEALLETTNGKASVALKDGAATTGEDGDEASFTTGNLGDRSVQTRVTLDSTNGNVSLGPA